MRKIMLAFAGTAALTAASAANAAITIGSGSQISINGSVITNTADASQATALDFTTGTTSNGSAPGILSTFNGGATGSFAGQFCGGPNCGTISDIATLALGPTSISPFFALTDGVTFSLTSITSIDRSVAGILGFIGTGTFGGTLGGVALNPASANFSFSTQGGNVTTFSATTTATTAVPEPVTWALMLLGFGGMGMALRRRRRPALAQVA
jgi:hypothetical protein